MKKLSLFFTIAVVALTFFSMTLSAQLPLRVVVNGKTMTFPDSQPFIDSKGRTQVPVRFVGEALGAFVDWNSVTRTVIITHESKRLELVIGKMEYTVDGNTGKMDTAALLSNGRTFVPIRFVSEGLGAKVEWDSEASTVYIETRQNDNSPKDVAFLNKHGYLVPRDTNIVIANSPESTIVETRLSINMLRENYEKQIADLAYAIESRFGKDISDLVINHVKEKKSRWDPLPEKYIYVKDTNQYIWISKSETAGISIAIMVPGYKAL